MQLENQVAIVTGSSRGIGKAIALALAKEGCNIVITSRTPNEIKETAKEIRELGVDTLEVKADVGNSNDVKNLVGKTVKNFGRVDILVNNAGILIKKPLVKMTEKEWDTLISINLKGAFLFSKEVLPYMTKQGNGVIVNISSGAGKHGYATLSAYCGSKFGLIGLTESLAQEVKKSHIKVYAVCPGMVATKMQYDIIGAATYKLTKGLMIKPEKIAKKVLELCLSNCKVPTGSSIEIYYP